MECPPAVLPREGNRPLPRGPQFGLPHPRGAGRDEADLQGQRGDARDLQSRAGPRGRRRHARHALGDRRIRRSIRLVEEVVRRLVGVVAPEIQGGRLERRGPRQPDRGSRRVGAASPRQGRPRSELDGQGVDHHRGVRRSRPPRVGRRLHRRAPGPRRRHRPGRSRQPRVQLAARGSARGLRVASEQCRRPERSRAVGLRAACSRSRTERLQRDHVTHQPALRQRVFARATRECLTEHPGPERGSERSDGPRGDGSRLTRDPGRAERSPRAEARRRGPRGRHPPDVPRAARLHDRDHGHVRRPDRLRRASLRAVQSLAPRRSRRRDRVARPHDRRRSVRPLGAVLSRSRRR